MEDTDALVHVVGLVDTDALAVPLGEDEGEGESDLDETTVPVIVEDSVCENVDVALLVGVADTLEVEITVALTLTVAEPLVVGERDCDGEPLGDEFAEIDMDGVIVAVLDTVEVAVVLEVMLDEAERRRLSDAVAEYVPVIEDEGVNVADEHPDRVDETVDVWLTEGLLDAVAEAVARVDTEDVRHVEAVTETVPLVVAATVKVLLADEHTESVDETDRVVESDGVSVWEPQLEDDAVAERVEPTERVEATVLVTLTLLVGDGESVDDTESEGESVDEKVADVVVEIDVHGDEERDTVGHAELETVTDALRDALEHCDALVDTDCVVQCEEVTEMHGLGLVVETTVVVGVVERDTDGEGVAEGEPEGEEGTLAVRWMEAVAL